MPTDKNGKFSRINPSDHTNHSKGQMKPSHGGDMPMSKSANSANTTEQKASVKPGQPISVKGVSDTGGSSTTAGNPSYSPISSANSKEQKSK